MDRKKFWRNVIFYVLVVLIPPFIVGLMLIITADNGAMVVGGIIFWGIDGYFGFKMYHYIEENKDIYRQDKKTIIQKQNNRLDHESLLLARELLVAYYLDLRCKTIKSSIENDELTKEEREILESKISLIESSIREYIIDTEEKYGSDFLTENPTDEFNQNYIFTLISKYSFYVSLYYAMGFDAYPVFSKKEVCLAIQKVLDTPSSATLTNDDFKLEILKLLK